ncbi:unnamed protein product [Absidia cylindrospora]
MSTTPTSSRECIGCHSVRSSGLLEGRTKSYRTCSICRTRQSPQLHPPMTMWNMSEVPHDFVDPDEPGEDGICLNVDIAMDEHLQGLTDEEIKELLETVRSLDGVEYFWKHAGNPELPFKVVCSQDREGKHVDESRLQRRYQRTTEFHCKGKVRGFIDRTSNGIQLIVSHQMNHPQPATLEASMIRTVPMTQEIKEFIQTQISMDNLNSIGLYEMCSLDLDLL